MSLFTSLHLAKQSLFATQVGIEVAGNNIANAETPGFIRERAVFAPTPDQRDGHLLIGSGVRVEAVVQQIDTYLESRLRDASSDLALAETHDQVYAQLEAFLGELSDSDLSTTLNNFFNSLGDVLNQPENLAIRQSAIVQGTEVSRQLQRLDTRVSELRTELNRRVAESASEINRLLNQVAELNDKIVTAELGGNLRSDAGGLRVQRYQALADLGKLIPIRATEEATGVVNVHAGGEFLVAGNTVHEVQVAYELDHRGLNRGYLEVAVNRARLPLGSGEVSGLVTGRDQILGGFLDDVDQFAAGLIFEFNKVHASGQGLEGFTELVSEETVAVDNQPLDEAGLAFRPENGSFQVLITNRQTGQTETHDVLVKLNGLEDDTTASQLVAELDAIDGLKASLTPSGRLQLQAEARDVEFALANDTSFLLAAWGVNTFFTGSAAENIQVAERIVANPQQLAASQNGIGHDSLNAERLAQLQQTPLASAEGKTLEQWYGQLSNQVTQQAAVSRAVTEGARVFHTTLESEKLSISGVNIDEEAINLITLQRLYQASARYVATVSDLLDVLVNL